MQERYGLPGSVVVAGIIRHARKAAGDDVYATEKADLQAIADTWRRRIQELLAIPFRINCVDRPGRSRDVPPIPSFRIVNLT